MHSLGRHQRSYSDCLFRVRFFKTIQRKVTNTAVCVCVACGENKKSHHHHQCHVAFVVSVDLLRSFFKISRLSNGCGTLIDFSFWPLNSGDRSIAKPNGTEIEKKGPAQNRHSTASSIHQTNNPRPSSPSTSSLAAVVRLTEKWKAPKHRPAGQARRRIPASHINSLPVTTQFVSHKICSTFSASSLSVRSCCRTVTHF